MRAGPRVERLTLVACVLGMSVVAGCADDHPPPARSNGVPLLVATDIPSGLAEHGTRHMNDEKPGAASWTLLGQPGDDPFGTRDAIVEVTPSPTGDPIFGPETVRAGRPALITEKEVPGRVNRQITWNEPGGSLVQVTSFHLDLVELHQVVEALSIDGTEVDIPSHPFELEPVGVIPLPIYVRGYDLGYEVGDRFLAIDVHPSSGDEMQFHRWGPTVADIVGDREVLRYLPEFGALPGYVFEYEPGIVIRITGNGVTEKELQAALMSLRPISQADFRAIPLRP